MDRCIDAKKRLRYIDMYDIQIYMIWLAKYVYGLTDMYMYGQIVYRQLGTYTYGQICIWMDRYV